MDQMKRYAVYYSPREGPFAYKTAEWLGRDASTGKTLPQPVLEGIGDPHAITTAARRYGFHGTLRAPFRPADGVDWGTVADRVAQLAARLPPATCDGLHLENLQGFVTLTPLGCGSALHDLGAAVVEATDDLRAPLSEAELARRRPDRLSARQRELLDRWGYPYVLEEFRFHLTLTDRLDAPGPVLLALKAFLAPVLPRPFAIEDLCLFGEDGDGRFLLLHRYPLSG